MLPATAALESVSARGGLILWQEPMPKCICAPLQAAVEYFRLMLPPWDAKGLCNDWDKMAVRLLGGPKQSTLCHALASESWLIGDKTPGVRRETQFGPAHNLLPCTPNSGDID